MVLEIKHTGKDGGYNIGDNNDHDLQWMIINSSELRGGDFTLRIIEFCFLNQVSGSGSIWRFY